MSDNKRIESDDEGPRATFVEHIEAGRIVFDHREPDGTLHLRVVENCVISNLKPPRVDA